MDTNCNARLSFKQFALKLNKEQLKNRTVNSHFLSKDDYGSFSMMNVFSGNTNDQNPLQLNCTKCNTVTMNNALIVELTTM